MRTEWAVIPLLLAAAPPTFHDAEATAARIDIRGKPQTLHLYGSRGGIPVVLTSGDGGWIHLGPHAAEVLASHGCFVVGFDARAYLSSFTSGGSTLDPREEPQDYRQLIDFAGDGSTVAPVLVGVSLGAGLSVLAAVEPLTHRRIGGVIGLGLPDENELGWRWTDSIIYVTKGIPKEPTFRVSAIIERVAPIPLAAIHATHDEFVPVDEVHRLMNLAGEPKRLWIVTASNHRFSDNQDEFDRRLLEALTWVRSQNEGPAR
jgi:hypothetical protein